eukprot:9312741-Pyramimonas_sp.AAC.1
MPPAAVAPAAGRSAGRPPKRNGRHGPAKQLNAQYLLLRGPQPYLRAESEHPPVRHVAGARGRGGCLAMARALLSPSTTGRRPKGAPFWATQPKSPWNP